jgi:predicted nucleic acid-binding protein
LRRVVDASPIIFLERVGLLDLLDEPGVTVLVPQTVLDELGGLDLADPAAVAARALPWIRIVAAPPIPEALRTFDLDPGEASVLAVALTRGEHDEKCQVVLDDRAARRCAEALGLKVRGSLSFMLIAKAEGRIAAVRPLLEQQQQSSMRLSEGLIRHVLDLAGE